jgi:hypothetical protein
MFNGKIHYFDWAMASMSLIVFLPGRVMKIDENCLVDRG